MQDRTLLAIFAHPDDETFGSGGTLARYAHEGARVVLVCATRGEVGEISDPALATPDNLGEVREQELRNAAHAMGFDDVRFLGYRDSGMAGTPDNDQPDAFNNADADHVVRQLVQIIREVQPDAVITFDPNGGYGHPDHVAIHRHTVAAFHAAGDPDRYPDVGTPYQPDRLWYQVIPAGMFRDMRERLAQAGIDTSQFDQMEQGNVGWPDDQVHAVIDVRNWIDAKQAAFNAHRTQFGMDNPLRRLPEDLVREIFSREHFALAWPAAQPGTHLTDLFDRA